MFRYLHHHQYPPSPQYYGHQRSFQNPIGSVYHDPSGVGGVDETGGGGAWIWAGEQRQKFVESSEIEIKSHTLSFIFTL